MSCEIKWPHAQANTTLTTRWQYWSVFYMSPTCLRGFSKGKNWLKHFPVNK